MPSGPVSRRCTTDAKSLSPSTSTKRPTTWNGELPYENAAPGVNSRGDTASVSTHALSDTPPFWHGLSRTPDVWVINIRGVIGGFDPANSGSHRAMSSSRPIAPSSTKVRNVAAVSHFVVDATSSGVDPDTFPLA